MKVNDAFKYHLVLTVTQIKLKHLNACTSKLISNFEFQRSANQVQLNFLSKCVRCNSQENILFHFGGEETQFLGLSASFIHQSHIWQW